VSAANENENERNLKMNSYEMPVSETENTATPDGYKYNPTDYADMDCLSDDMTDFYRLLEIYRRDKTSMNETLLYKQGVDLLFSIKHRVVEGCITEYQAQEMREYFRELNDCYRIGGRQ
jgi:hypothetical protein